MILHGYYRSSAAFRVRIALNLKGLACDQVNYHLRKGEQHSAALATLNPQGLVPALEVDGTIVRQSLAIIEYLDEIYSLPPLLPPLAQDRAHVRCLAQIVACDIHPIDNLRVLNYLREDLQQDDAAVADWYNHWIGEGFAAIEKTLTQDRRTGDFCYGDAPTLADICLIPQVINAANFALDLTIFPTIRRIFDSAMRLDAFAAAHPARQPDAEPSAP